MKKENPFESKDNNIPFKNPILDLYEPHKWNKVLPDLFDKYNSLIDERAMVIFWALVVESELDRVIKIIFPKHETIVNSQRGFNFGNKISIFKALHLIPPAIFDFMTTIKNIRNEFAHNLKIDKIEDLNKMEKKQKNILKKLDELCTEYESALLYSKNKNNYINKFKDIGKLAIEGLRYFEVNLTLFREEILKDEFSQKLQETAKEKKQQQDEEFKKNRLKYYGNK